MSPYEKLKKRWLQERDNQKDRATVFKKRLMEKGTPIFKRYNIQMAYLFGSVASGTSRDNSDIDLYVSALPVELYWQFRHELEEAVQLPIDLYTDNDDPLFVKKVMARGEKIYGI